MSAPLAREKATGAALAERRVAWLTRLSAPRGRSAKGMSVAQWEASEGLARVLRAKGSELQSLGQFKGGGQQWLRPEEALCLVDDGTLMLLHEGAPLSVQAARALLTGPLDGQGEVARRLLQLQVFGCLHRNGYICRVAETARAADPPLLDAYERRGFSRRAVGREGVKPAFFVACFRADGAVPVASSLGSLARHCAPTPLRCACVQQDEVVFFDVSEGIERAAAGTDAQYADSEALDAQAGTDGGGDHAASGVEAPPDPDAQNAAREGADVPSGTGGGGDHAASESTASSVEAPPGLDAHAASETTAVDAPPGTGGGQLPPSPPASPPAPPTMAASRSPPPLPPLPPLALTPLPLPPTLAAPQSLS